ncbi:TPA: purine-nucleoside phosphorylase, partial [Campylobacter jejuni]|nr:purine-nucleoside phosphorylase [Campylobacter jejuni]HEF3505040.1 purine-nucleoside phosphorylase [Campylobacter jejuni]
EKENVSRETIKINSSNYICKNSKAAKEFSKLGFFAENMEAFSVLSVAKNLNIDAECILCATNFCNENAHEDFIKNHQKAKEKLEEYLKKYHYI